MSEKTTIFYFSATGNSLDAAKRVATKLENATLYSMTGPPPDGQIGGPNQSIGFVFPVYFGMLPRLCQRFIETLDIKADTYCFALVTAGGVGGSALTVLDELLRTKNIRLAYGAAVRTMRNYIVKYNPPADPVATLIVRKAEPKLEQAAKDIANQAQNKVRHLKFTYRYLYKNTPDLDKQFLSRGSCTGCGQCQRLCPVDNIRVKNGRPVWQHHCEHCMACIHWCPVGAIQYGNKTVTRNRYHHPDITVEEMLAAREMQE